MFSLSKSELFVDIFSLVLTDNQLLILETFELLLLLLLKSKFLSCRKRGGMTPLFKMMITRSVLMV